MPGIERILGEHGVPAIVKCLPFVESMYNYRARSRVGASGVWQIMPGTARQYVQMDSAVDARSDVWLAAEGAARLLADNYRRVCQLAARLDRLQPRHRGHGACGPAGG